MKKKELNFVFIIIVGLILVFFRQLDALVFGKVNFNEYLFVKRFGVFGITYNLRALTFLLLGYLMARPAPKIFSKWNGLLKYGVFILLLLISNIYLVNAFIRVPNILSDIFTDRSTIIVLRILTGYYLGLITGKERDQVFTKR